MASVSGMNAHVLRLGRGSLEGEEK
jgi:hypothetical protein